jgi:hypothetical protein
MKVADKVIQYDNNTEGTKMFTDKEIQYENNING